MTKVTYIQSSGKSQTVELTEGQSVMEGAIRNGVPGIDADCGGACACATCHVYVAPEWIEKLPAPSAGEASMLEFASHVQSNSRLSCQIKVDPSFEGLVVTLPISQQ